MEKGKAEKLAREAIEWVDITFLEVDPDEAAYDSEVVADLLGDKLHDLVNPTHRWGSEDFAVDCEDVLKRVEVLTKYRGPEWSLACRELTERFWSSVRG